MIAIDDRQVSARLAACMSCPNYRPGLRIGWCLRLREGSELVRAELFSDELYRRVQDADCLVKWSE